MAFLPQGSVGQVTDAYRNNPGALQERYGVTKQLIDLMALQRINAEQQAIANQMEMDLGAQANKDGKIADEVAMEAFDNTTKNIAQMSGLGGILNERNAQAGGPQAGGPQAGGPPQGIDQIPAQNMQRMSDGGIVAFARGSDDAVDASRLRDLQTNRGPKDENIALLDEMLDAEGVTDLEERAFIRAIYEQESSSGTNPSIWEEEGGYAESANIGDMQMSEIARRELERVGLADEGELDLNTREGNMRGGIRYALLGLEKAGGDVELGATFYYGGPGGLEAARSGEARYDFDGPDMPSTLEYGSEVADMTSEIFGSLGYVEPDAEGVAQTTGDARAAEDLRRATAPEVDVDELTQQTMDRRAAAREAAYGEEEEEVDVFAEYGLSGYDRPGVAGGSHLRELGKYGDQRERVGKSGEEIMLDLGKTMNLVAPADYEAKKPELVEERTERDTEWEEIVRQGETPNADWEGALAAYTGAGANTGQTAQGYDDATAGIDPRMRALYEALGGEEGSAALAEKKAAEARGTGAATTAPSTGGLNWEELTEFLSNAQGTTTGSALGAGAQAMTTGRHARETLDRDEALQYAKIASDIQQIELRNKNELDQIRATAKADMDRDDRLEVDAAWREHVKTTKYMADMTAIGEMDAAQQDVALSNYIMTWYDRQRSMRELGLADYSSILGTGTTTVANTGT